MFHSARLDENRKIVFLVKKSIFCRGGGLNIIQYSLVVVVVVGVLVVVLVVVDDVAGENVDVLNIVPLCIVVIPRDKR